MSTSSIRFLDSAQPAGPHRYLLRVSDVEALGLLVTALDEPGVLYRISEAIFRHGANITYIAGGAHRDQMAELQLEVTGAGDEGRLVADLVGLKGITKVSHVPTFQRIYGKRVIVIGGGAQVGMVAQGAISEADRHNIRGERISVDTIPLVGEEQLAQAVRAVARLHRARALVLAGALMGGDIAKAVREIKDAGIIVLCTNMAGSVPEAADVVVSDPVEAGVMAVMLIADTASFSIEHVRGRRF
jgi:energy-converting hydrogenase B subunit Q